MTQLKKFFPYSWVIDEEETNVTSIRIYGLNEQDKNVCLHINDFTPFIYLELPTHIPWTESKVLMIIKKLDTMLGEHKPIKHSLMWKKRLYYSHLTPSGKTKEFPYIFMSFSSKLDIKKLGRLVINSINVQNLGFIKLKIHEQDASPILQFTSARNLSPAGWLEYSGKQVPEEELVTRCDEEYTVKWKNVRPYERVGVANPLCMGFDIEVNSTNPCKMPTADIAGNKIFQISCVLFRHGSTKYNKYILTLGEPDPKIVGTDVEIQMFETEGDLITGYTEFIQEHNPNIIIGYNIFGFDIPYMITRDEFTQSFSLNRQGFHKYKKAPVINIKWGSRAYGNQTFHYLDAEGRLYVDLLPLIKRDYKFDNYKLKTVSSFFLGEENTKDPLSVKGIFKCYRIGMQNKNGIYSARSKKAMGIVSKYCFAEGTRVSLVHGTMAIEKLTVGNNLLSWNEKSNTVIVSNQSYFFNNGVKQCIELELEDGRKLVCTPDHLISNEKGDWIKSSDSLNCRVKIGPILPETVTETKDMILGRILGYLYTSGSIGKVCYARVRNLMDSKIFANDVMTLYGVYPTIKKDNDCYIIYIPTSVSLKSIYLWDKSVMIEFLGGMFGGCGLCPHVFAGNIVNQIGFKQYRNNLNSVVEYMDIVGKWLIMFNIRSEYNVKFQNLRYVGHLNIHQNDIETFITTIGYRYCYHKTLRASVAVIHNKLKNKFPCVSEFISMIGADCIFSGEYSMTNDQEYLPTFSLNIISVKDIGERRVYDIEVNDTHSYIAEGMVVHNCVQDSLLCVQLFNKIQTWVGLCEMASVCCVPPFYLYTQGQQIKVYSQIYKYCYFNNFVVEKDAYIQKDNEHYQGASVHEPIPGVYDKVVPFDFCLTGDTMITLADGCSKRLDSIDGTELVVGYKDNKLGNYYIRGGLQHKGLRDTIKICLQDGRIITTTSDHKFLLGSGEWCVANELKNKYVMCGLNYDLSKTLVVDIVPNGVHQVFDMEVDTAHSFLANGVVAHNCALYPSIIIAYNIDYSTYTTDVKIPDSMCHVIAFSEHQGCVHDKTVRKTKPKYVLCGDRRYRFLKEPKGVMPTVLQNLLNARVHTRSEIKVLQKRLKEEKLNDAEKKSFLSIIEVLDKRQLAYKISANSAYGSMGVTAGYLPFMVGAMCVTAMGRYNIEIVKKIIPEKFGGQMVYSDTDSAYVTFPDLNTSEELWQHAEYVAKEVTKLCPQPLSLEFENTIYWVFFMLTKKRYMSLSCGRDGKVSTKINKKGVLLARRDTSNFNKELYSSVIMDIFNRKTRDQILSFLVEEINKLCSGVFHYDRFIVTKSVGSHGDFQVNPFVDEKGRKKGLMGDYKVPLLSTCLTEKKRQYKLKNCGNAKDYYLRCLPAQVQLAEKMRNRGQRVDVGTRLEYVIIDEGGAKAKQYEKIEDSVYFSQHKRVLKIDYMYYLKSISTSMDQVLNIMYYKDNKDNKDNKDSKDNKDNKDKYIFAKNFALTQYKYRLQKQKTQQELLSLFEPKLVFV